AVQTAAEPGQLTTRSDHPVAGHDDGDRILAVGGADGAGGARVAEAARQLAVARSRAVRDGAQDVPHASLKCRANRGKREVEGRAAAGEVLSQLLAGASEHRAGGSAVVVLDPARLLFRRRTVTAEWKEHSGQRSVRGREDELA